MKFYMVVDYYLVNFDLKFHEDPCINARVHVVNTRAHVISRICVFTTRLRGLDANISATKARIFMKFYVEVTFYLVSLSVKYH